ncbi:LamG-like jellyroll fold domain-containing protein [Populibacterium corticicola]|uniref:LamG-like jellyroll fold domain-containing protein n=1 Tax=Populibacterium corticicola TaxID=1812826 RepID=A0ABW5XFP8_9MICO
MPNHTTKRAVAALTAGMLGISALLVGSAAQAKPKDPTPRKPTFTNVTVHDPSVVTSGKDVWVFGSHGASAHTRDLMNWTQHTVDLSQDRDNTLFDDIYTELKETFDWAQTDTLWASDVIQLKDGRYAMYYNACKGDSPRSALGLAIADSVDGPYKDQGILLKSGMWDEESENPGEIYDANIHPNAVDPDAFFDAKGNLWMVYGSYSGGIFILQMDKNTGLPLPDQGYGKHLIGGNHSRIEAPAIQYNKQTGYYYMYVSFGGLDANGGYNMRVARSKKPDGPYVDAQGNDMANVKSNRSLPLFDDASIEPYGVKMMGSHLFTRELGDPASGTESTSGIGYQSPGHNTWYQDPKTGKTFLIFHARFPDTGEMHQVRVQQIWFNKDGWPVLSPMQYAGETNRTFKRKEVEGTWQVINMGKDINSTAKLSEEITLTKNGKITGAYSGKWKLTSHNYAELQIGKNTYKGVFMPIWDPQYQKWSVGFSAVSKQGETIMGRSYQTMSQKEAVKAVTKAIDLGNIQAVTGNLTLPTSGTHGTTITWKTSDSAVVTDTGVTTRPGVGESPRRATLTATIRNGKHTEKRTFKITVLPREAAQLGAQWTFDGDLVEATGTYADATPSGAKIDLAGNPAQYVSDGVSGQALYLDGNSGVRLPDGLIHSDTYSVSLWLRPEALTSYTTAFFGAATSESWVSLVPRGHDGVNGNAMVWSGTAWYDAGTGVNLPVGEWSHVAFVNDRGTLSVYVDGVLAFEGTGFPNVFTTENGMFTLGVNWWDTAFKGSIDELTVWTSALTAQDVAQLGAR